MAYIYIYRNIQYLLSYNCQSSCNEGFCHRPLRMVSVMMAIQNSRSINACIELIKKYMNGMFSNSQAHPNTEKVLQYYESKGIVQVQQHVHPPQLLADQFSPGARNFHDLRQELLPLNDCLYRAVASRELRWLGVFDLDELIVPVRFLTLLILL